LGVVVVVVDKSRAWEAGRYSSVLEAEAVDDTGNAGAASGGGVSSTADGEEDEL
jgi:hypothetical protein